jgi:NADPH:quinone reductase-like Zn-dependent oxidoreductase
MPPPWLLVNGAGGGVGGFTVQLAKEAGAIVIATASPRSTDTVRALGADHIVDYTATTIAEAVKDPVDVVVNLVAGSREDKGDRTVDERWALIRSAMEDQASGAMHVDPGTRDHVYTRAEVEALIAMTAALLCVTP